MLRAIAAGALLFSAAAASGEPAAAAAGAQPGKVGRLGAPTLTAAQIVERHVAARGGLGAWRKVEAMAWMGRVEGGSPAPMPPRWGQRRVPFPLHRSYGFGAGPGALQRRRGTLLMSAGRP